MKKCPSCQKTFEDSMRFCQADGTPLVEDAPPMDPYKTIVARPIDISELTLEPVAEPSAPVVSNVETPTPFEPAVETSEVAQPEVEVLAPLGDATLPPIHAPDDILELPSVDPLKTMYVSEDEMRQAMGSLDVPADPLPETPAIVSPEPPRFTEPEIPSPSFGDLSPAAPEITEPEHSSPQPDFGATAPPIVSPFDAAPPVFSEPTPAEPEHVEPPTIMQEFPPASPFDTPSSPFTPVQEQQFTPAPAEPVFKEPEPFQPAVGSPFQQDLSPAAWTPPPAPDASWQNQEIGQNTPFQPPPAGGAINQTLPIVSLILGIVSLCCYIAPLTGIAALVTGYLGLKNIKKDPANYGGRGLALGGMIAGGILAAVTIVYYVVIILIYAGLIGASILSR